MKYTRDILIKICKDAVVHHTKWNDRDSHIAQCSIQDIYLGLTAGLDYNIDQDSNKDCIWIRFSLPIDTNQLSCGDHLEISSREEYFADCDPDHETEMFQGYGIDFYSNSEYKGGFMPTRKRLEEVDGEDWY